MSTIVMKTVEMKDGSKKIKLETPFHPELPARMRKLGGAWSAERKAWYFPTDLEAELRKLCVDIFSIDPLAAAPVDQVNVRIDVSPLSFDDTFWAMGRSLLRRPGRDVEVKPGDGVSILSGGFTRTGGSARYPSIGSPKGETVLLVRDVPRTAVEEYIAANPELTITIVEQEAETKSAKVFEQAKEMAAQFGKLAAQLDEAQRREIYAILEANLKEVA